MSTQTGLFVRTFRTVWRYMVPGWLHTGDGELVQLTEGTALDAFAEACRQTAWLMLPSLAPSDALAKIGADRAIPRGALEPDASYRNRLRTWRYPFGHRTRGNATGLLEQIAAVFGGAVDDLRTVDARGTEYTWASEADGGTTVTRGVAWDWDGEALTPNWGRFWVFLRPTGAAPWPSFDDGAWGDTIDAPDICHDMQGVHPGAFGAIERLCSSRRMGWAPAGTRAIYCVVDVTGAGLPTPTGDWESWENRADGYAYRPLQPSII